MDLTAIDFAVIALYFASCIGIGIFVGGNPKDASGYFLSDNKIPWWIIAFSIVATETSMLTVISTPAIAYGGSLVFLQLGIGYIIGRFLVAQFILPTYFNYDRKSTYAFLGARFGLNFRKVLGGVFLTTRLLADGVRLFAAAIPIKLITGFDYSTSIAIIGILTLTYSYFGGIKSVIWIDAIQLVVYILAGVWIIESVLSQSSISAFFESIPIEKWTVFGDSNNVLTSAYSWPAAIFGGLFLSMASHGTDHLIVQRCLAAKNVSDAKKSMIFSGFLVTFQFFLFLMAGLALYHFYGGASVESLGLTRGDEILPKFVIEELPPIKRALIIAGLLAAAMSTLSSSLTALSSTTLFDLFPQLALKNSVGRSRMLMVFWSFVFWIFAASFSTTNNPVIELGLGIAGFTYGALFGAFVLGKYSAIKPTAALIALILTVLCMSAVIFTTALAWPWYTLTGSLIFAATAYISNKAMTN